MQALASPCGARAGAARCCASQGAAATPTHVAPQAAAALSRRQTLCAGAAMTLGVQPRRASAAPATFISAAGLLFLDEKVGAGEEAQAGDVVKILYSAHTVNADGASTRCRYCSAFSPRDMQASWATSSILTAAQAPAQARRTKSRWATPTRTSPLCEVGSCRSWAPPAKDCLPCAQAVAASCAFRRRLRMVLRAIYASAAS